jgi:uncharacterized membrane protein
MLQFPPLASWDAIHPLIIHFPIALLLLTPFLIVVGALRSPERARTILYVALGIMIVGTAGTYLAVASGETAAQLAERSPQVNAVLEHHEELAEATRVAFSVLTVVFAAILLIPEVLKKTSNRILSRFLPLAFLVLYGGGVMLLANTAHNGGRLVHEFGVRAAVKPSPLPAPAGDQEANKEGSTQTGESQSAGNRD